MFHTFDASSKSWISRHPAFSFDPQTNLGRIILDKLKQNPEKVLQIDADSGRELTSREMRLRAIRVAQNLASLGFRQGDMVAMACSNSENVTPIALGLWIAGMPFICLPVAFNAHDLGHLLGLVQPQLVICDDGVVYKAVLDGAGQTLKIKPVIFVMESELESVRKVEELLQETGTEEQFTPPTGGNVSETIGTILCTSGTTGRPKGVCVSQTHIAIVLERMRGPPGAPTDAIFNFSPLYWGSGLNAMLTSIANGTTRILTRSGFNEDVFFDILEKYRPTHFSSPPSYAVLILNHRRAELADFSCLKSWGLTGSHASWNLRQRIEANLPNGKTYNYYASSEIGIIALEMAKRKENAVGQLAPHLDAKVVDESGEAVGIGERGELLIRTKIPLLGYYNDEQATRDLIDSDGWIRTGDIGYLDEESFIFLMDRKKDVVKYRGYQMSPVDLEAIIEKMEGVGQVCVVGVPEMDGASDLPAAVIVKREGSTLTEQQVLEEVERQVSDHKRLRGGVFFWAELPLTATGKVLRRQVREKLVEIVEEMKGTE